MAPGVREEDVVDRIRAATAVKAIAMLEAAGVPDARRLLADYAAAALVRSYALVIDTIGVEGPRTIVRGAAVPAELWQRIVREGATHDVWTGGTVRLEPGDLVGGAPAVDITGIGFHQAIWIVSSTIMVPAPSHRAGRRQHRSRRRKRRSRI